jgi:tetratricopeptide (TPR) repeat protein
MELHEDERWDEAIAAFRRSIEAGHREEIASFNIACAFARKGDTDRAFEWLGKAEASGFEVASHLDDSDLDSLRSDRRFTELKAKARKARSGKNGEKVRKAGTRLELLLAQSPRNGRALFDVGRDLLAGGEYDRAAEAYVAAAEAGRREGTSFYNAACARALQGRNAEALDLLERAVAAGYDGPGHLRNDDDLDGLRSEPRFDRIVKDAEALSLEGFPSLGARLLRSQMEAEAEEEAARFTSYLKEHPRSGRAWSSLGTISLAAEKDREAARAFAKALELGYRRPATTYNLACAHARLKERDAAFAWLDRAIDLGAATADHIEEDDDLWNLRRDPRFEKAVEKARRTARER